MYKGVTMKATRLVLVTDQKGMTNGSKKGKK